MKKQLLLFAALVIFNFVAKAQWTEQNSNLAAGKTIQNFDIVDANIVWASGLDTANLPHLGFCKTTNGGTAWTAGTINGGASADYSIAGIAAVSSTAASVALYDGAVGGGAIYGTTNGGTTWVKTSGSNFATTAAWPNIIHFYDATNGVCMGDPNGGGTPAEFEILLTSNAGASWTRVVAANIPNPQTGEYGLVNTFSAHGDRLWFGTNKSRIYYSYDKGATWAVKKATAVAGTGSIYKINFQDDTHGFTVILNAAGTALSALSKTTDGGVTWTAFTGIIGAESFYLADISSPKPDFTISAAGYNTGISMDYGSIWVPGDSLPDTEVISALGFLSDSLGWAGTISSGAANGGIYKYQVVSTGINHFVNKDITVDVFPNPNNGTFTLAVTSQEKQSEVSVYNMVGKLVYQNNNIPAGTNFQKTIDLSGYSKGVYLLTIKNGEQLYTKKVLIE